MKYFPVIILACTLFACADRGPIVNPQDYSLTDFREQRLTDCNEEIRFWEKKLSDSPGSPDAYSKLGGAYSKRFAITGRIEDLYTSDSLYQRVLAVEPNRVGALQALAVNCMSRHQFKDANDYLRGALKIGDNKSSTLFSVFDVKMELGDYAGAAYTLSKFENKHAFAYLVREAKLEDQRGDADEAIRKMEAAFERIKDDPMMFAWTLSNLGDMYSHAGRIEEAYKAYLGVLKRNPGHDFALKGIAWIAFSHDRNTAEAKRIANYLLTVKDLPDMHLMLAQLADYENNLVEKKAQLDLFMHKAQQPKYKDMYAKYIALLKSDDFADPTGTIAIAQKEIDNRPTPQSYDLLAWGYYKKGQRKEALNVAKQFVEGKTFEPEAYYHLGMIYQSVDQEKSKIYLSEARKGAFELGPAVAESIAQALD